jgi:N-dimethylarginine dimethylaminohydrolase
MLVDTVADLRRALDALAAAPRAVCPAFRRVLMVSPEYFRVEYAINPYMKSAGGELKQVDVARAMEEWQRLREAYIRLGVPVIVLPGEKNLPDMVFAANQGFPFRDPKSGRTSCLMSRMRSEFRRGEVPFFKRWFEANGYETLELETPGVFFEGNGDAHLHPGLPLVWGGVGPRTTLEAQEEIARRFDLAVVPLELRSPDFYHLDTCFTLLNAETVAYLPDAFSPSSRKLVEAGFRNVIPLGYDECHRYFSGNCHCPNGRDVLIQEGNRRFNALLERAGFTVHELDTSEFMKSGGSVFCMKMMIF